VHQFPTRHNGFARRRAATGIWSRTAERKGGMIPAVLLSAIRLRELGNEHHIPESTSRHITGIHPLRPLRLVDSLAAVAGPTAATGLAQSRPHVTEPGARARTGGLHERGLASRRALSRRFHPLLLQGADPWIAGCFSRPRPHRRSPWESGPSLPWTQTR